MKRFLLALVVLLMSSIAIADVNVNSATLDQLEALPGIGPVKAQAIIDYRKANGPFKSVDDLKHVKGIGAKRLEKLRPELTVGPTAKVAAAGTVKADAKAPGQTAKGEIRPVADAGRK